MGTPFVEKGRLSQLNETKFDVLAKEFVATYSSLSATEKGRLDGVKPGILNAFGTEPKKKLFNKNIHYKIFQTMKGYFSQIGWTSPAKK